MTDDPFAFLDEPLPPTDVRTFIPDFILDEFDAGISEYDAACAFGYHMISRMQLPKMLKTVREHLLRENRFLLRLAEIEPSVFDEVMCAYAERALTVDEKYRPKQPAQADVPKVAGISHH